jgi:hypothetical protein
MESINKNNIKTLKSIVKLLENENNKWPLPIMQHKIAYLNALNNAIDTGEVVLSFGGIKNMANDATASQKIDLFSDLDQKESVLNPYINTP